MGLLLSVLVACVGVIELIAFYYNVKRNLTLRPTHGDLSVISEGYIQGLYDVRKRIVKDIQNLQKDSSPPVSSSSLKENIDKVQGPLPAVRLNSHEDIEIELNKNVVARSRSATPRRYLVKEKEVDAKNTTRSDSPRRFLVSEEPQGLQKSKCKTSLPEYFIQQQINLEKSPNHPRYVLKDEEGSGPSIPLPKQFVVTESETGVSVFEDASSKISDEDSLSSSAEYYRRSPSPYPPLELPHSTRNNINNKLINNSNSVVEEDEELYKSREAPSPIINQSNSSLTTTDYSQKETIVPTEKSPSASNGHELVFSNKKVVQVTNDLERSKSKIENHISQNIFFQSIQTHSQISEKQENDLFSTPSSSFEEVEENIILENASFDENCLNSLDGVSKQNSIRRSCNSRRSIRRKNTKDNSLDKSDVNSDIKSNSQKLPDTSNYQKAAAGSTKAQNQEVASTSKTAENKTPEPFWLIFSGEYTKAMNKDWHGQHFCCWQCDESLTGQRYVLRDDHPYCVSCYESVFANACEKCSRTIGIDSKDLSYKDKHWHEACFLCTTCGESLVDKQFGSKGDRIYCGSCYDQQFASRCDGCHEIFRAGTKKMEYKTRQWHEKCFCCCVCKTPIGTQSFIPREQEIYCAKCYEEKFATRCIKCNKVITSGGVTYKNEPWHRECFVCTHCQKSLAGERFTSRDEKPFCAECFGELFAKRCTACNKPITGIGGTKFISFEDRHWHNDCFFCASCRTSLVGRGFITDQEDIICPDCAKQKLM